MAFKNVNTEFRARIESISATMRRLHALTSPFLAGNLLRLSRVARAEAPSALGDPRYGTYDVNLVWQVIPTLAKRTGSVSLLPNEATDADITCLDDRELRCLVGVYLNNSGLGTLGQDLRSRDDVTPLAIDILGHEFVNGNPIAMVADRLCEPAPEGEDQGDWLARHMREISRVRFGHARFSSWQPEFQDFPKSEVEYAALTARIQEGPEPW